MWKAGAMDKVRASFLDIISQGIFSVLLISFAILNAPSFVFVSSHTVAENVQPTKYEFVNSTLFQESILSLRQEESQDVHDVAQQYMRAMIDQQPNVMWSLLHPQMQSKWQNETTFARFLQIRFKEYTLSGFVLGKAQPMPYWTDPETMMVYSHLEEISVSLQLTPRFSLSQTSTIPSEDLHASQLFQNLPIIMQYGGNQDGKGGNWLIVSGGPADLEAPILPLITPVNRIVQVPILMYHHVTSFVSDDPLSDYIRTWVVSPDSFSQQMDYLSAHHYHTITFNQLFDALYYGGPLPSRPIILTFDDGDADHYQYVYPILLAHHFSGMFYIISGQVGWYGRMTWPQLREMLLHGMQMGSHTVHHVDLSRLLYVSEDAVQQELQQSQQTLAENLHVNIQQFCYPYGDPFNWGNWFQQQKIMSMLANDGYVGATTAFGMTGSLQSSANPLALLRIPVYGTEWFQSFVSSLPWN
jgi:peptidoglycan/xylan/chitin deacetylase (PgdA/CDA1 family)